MSANDLPFATGPLGVSFVIDAQQSWKWDLADVRDAVSVLLEYGSRIEIEGIRYSNG